MSSRQYLGEIILCSKDLIKYSNFVVNVNKVSGCIFEGTCFPFFILDCSRFCGSTFPMLTPFLLFSSLICSPLMLFPLMLSHLMYQCRYITYKMQSTHLDIFKIFIHFQSPYIWIISYISPIKNVINYLISIY